MYISLYMKVSAKELLDMKEDGRFRSHRQRFRVEQIKPIPNLPNRVRTALYR